MPVLRGSVTFSRYRVELAEGGSSDWKRSLPRGLRAAAFEPIDRKNPDEERAAGFVELENAESVEFPPGAIFNGHYALFGYRVDTLKVPGAALKAELTRWEQAFQKENGRKPSRGEKAENRASIRHLLMQRSVPVTKTFDVSWQLQTGELQIWAGSRKQTDEIAAAIEEAFKVKLEGKVPVAVARRAGVAEETLTPTAALAGGSALEAIDGQA